MTPEFAVQIIKQALMTTLWVSAPILVVGVVAGVAISLVQIATSLQDTAFSSVPRLAVFLVALLLLLPWMVSRMMSYTTLLFGDLSRYAK